LRFRTILLVTCMAIGLLCGCESGPQERKVVGYKTSAKENFTKGVKAFEDEDYLEATEYFKFVKSKFPYSRYATDSDLYLADCHFERERFLEAADAYIGFVKLHPKHPKMPYAMFRVGLCYFNRIPDDWFITPPAYELDQAETMKAIRELRRYLNRFPDHENAKEAREHLQTCLRRMGKRTRYVMNFYRKRNHYRGVLWRANEILGKYAELGFDEEALYCRAEAQLKLEQFVEARTSLQELLSRFPEGDWSDDARDLLAEVNEQKTTGAAVDPQSQGPQEKAEEAKGGADKGKAKEGSAK